MGWDWVKVLKEEMFDLKSDEHLSRHAATDRLAWVSSQAPARAPSPVDDWRDYPPNTPPAGGALLGFDEQGSDGGRSSLSGFNDGPLYGGADHGADGGAQHPAGPVDVPSGRPELPRLDDFDFAMPTAPPLEFPAAQAPDGFGAPLAGASLSGASLLSNPAPAPGLSPFGSPSPFDPPRPPANAGQHPGPTAAQSPSQNPGHHGVAAGGPGQSAYGRSGYGEAGPGGGGYEQGCVLTLLIDGVLAGVALPAGGEVSVGRERQSTLVIPESKQTVSRRAATLVRTGQRTVEARIENRNGAWVTRQLPEGTRQEFVERGKGVTLRIGDRLALDPPGTVVVGLGEPH